MGDFFVEVKKPSEKATEGLYQTLSLSKTVENLAKGDMMWPDGKVKLLSDQVLDSVDVAEALWRTRQPRTTPHGRAVEDGTFHPSNQSDEKDWRRVGDHGMVCVRRQQQRMVF